MSTVVTNLLLPAVVGMIWLTLFWMPRLTRPGIWFSVTIQPGFQALDEARRTLRNYRLSISVHSAGAMACVLFGLRSQRPLLLGIGVTWQLIGSIMAFLTAHRRVLPHGTPATSVREAAVGPRPRLPGGWLLQSGPFALLMLTGLWIARHWEQIPERIPIHWGVTGTPDRWIARSAPHISGLLLVAAVPCLGLLLLSYALVSATRRVRAIGPAGAAERRFRLINLGILLGVEYLVALSFALPLLFSATADFAASLAIISIGTMALLTTTFLLLARAGQGGSLQARPTDDAESPQSDHIADVFWKWGLFYVNRGDSSLFVEKRFGLGYTLNFGNPLSWVLLCALVVVVAGAVGALFLITTR